jgi:hypothetical protein
MITSNNFISKNGETASPEKYPNTPVITVTRNEENNEYLFNFNVKALSLFFDNLKDRNKKRIVIGRDFYIDASNPDSPRFPIVIGIVSDDDVKIHTSDGTIDSKYIYSSNGNMRSKQMYNLVCQEFFGKDPNKYPNNLEIEILTKEDADYALNSLDHIYEISLIESNENDEVLKSSEKLTIKDIDNNMNIKPEVIDNQGLRVQ